MGIVALIAIGAFLLTKAPGLSGGGFESGDDVTMLARMLASEASSQGDAARTAIAYSALNKARKSGKSFAAMSNGIGPCCKGRPWSTARAGSARDLADAKRILAIYPSGDPTYGSTTFFEPAVQDLLFKQGREGYKSDAADIRRRWTAEGKVLTARIGGWEFYA